jgi:riboflavin kinase/FMN adenylyltransferase
MRVIFNYNRNYSTDQPSAIALGTFDGIHLGHRQLIYELQQKKKKYDYQTIVYTFMEHPLSVLAPDREPPRIMLLKEKIREFSKLDIDVLILNSFDQNFLRQTPREFLDNLYDKIPIKTFVVGFNFRFGHKGAGNIAYLEKEAQEKRLELISVPPVMSDGEVVSSTLIRGKIQEGKVREAAKLLTAPYSISGKVIKGFGRGKDLGFPTANLAYSPYKVLPACGVYLTKSLIKGEYVWGLTSVGTNPTFSNGQIQIETYLLDYNENIYGQYMRVSFIDWLRKEIKFESPEALSRQIQLDMIKAKKLIYKKSLL